MTLFIDACPRASSRTRRLAQAYLAGKDDVTAVKLSALSLPPVTEETLAQRERLVEEEAWDHPLLAPARQFAAAAEIVLAAPYWDLSFPAALKQYLEQINVVGVTFCYTPEGVPRGLCRAKKLTYVTTAGGGFAPEEYGFGYVQALARLYWGIERVEKICAQGLDLDGADPEAILQNAIDSIKN